MSPIPPHESTPRESSVRTLQHILDPAIVTGTRLIQPGEDQFLQFALAWVKNISEQFLAPDLSRENRLRCKQIIFPAGFRLNKNQKVYTPEISPLITLAANKKDLPVTEKSSMVRVKRL